MRTLESNTYKSGIWGNESGGERGLEIISSWGRVSSPAPGRRVPLAQLE